MFPCAFLLIRKLAEWTKTKNCYLWGCGFIWSFHRIFKRIFIVVFTLSVISFQSRFYISIYILFVVSFFVLLLFYNLCVRFFYWSKTTIFFFSNLKLMILKSVFWFDCNILGCFFAVSDIFVVQIFFDSVCEWYRYYVFRVWCN